jgi:hypothetical protein
MPSATFELFRQAMAERKQVICIYQDRRRELCPIVLGTTDGKEKALTYQFAGESSKPMRSPKDRWRCLSLDEVSAVELRAGPWHSGTSHSEAQTCVKDVYYDVNPQSPFNPRYRLENQ